jgi:tetraprenyl-beta-curcumene synthase
LQTISDYLDTICDRGSSDDGRDFRRLHRAIVDAVSLEPRQGDYYALHPQRDDAGYLETLVATARAALASLPGYPAVEPAAVVLAERYAQLQELKHLRPRSRGEEALARWHSDHGEPDLAWWEFAAACGSTLAIFALLRLAALGTPSAALIERTVLVYRRTVCILHILLDYTIDRDEDTAHDELNLVAYYRDSPERIARLAQLARAARVAAARLPESDFHLWVAAGLPGLYLADRKVAVRERSALRPVLTAGGAWSRIVYLAFRTRSATWMRW